MQDLCLNGLSQALDLKNDESETNNSEKDNLFENNSNDFSNSSFNDQIESNFQDNEKNYGFSSANNLLENICNKSGVPYTHRDRSEIKRTQESITRKASHNQKSKESVIDLTNDELPTKSSLKRSSVNRNKSLKKSKQEKSEEISTMNEISQLEIEERKMALRERAAEVRKKEAEAEALEIANSQRKKENESFI
ncbi:hypothetical protein RhiirC2_871149 [Rhizophagus irregularis]|uniref:Uncharacterized protein n=1 Tax=Rhizophagus irregularis TaxID=588596 RepID=A0A2N1MDV1_9GLOM|nr:hypothetical protein RhiirC2_871149 [Rhizophagus irregularis]